MQYKTAALFAVGLASSAAATGWLDEDAYSVPSNTDNKCSEQQQGGYDWSGLDEGSFSSYGSNSFSGFSCGNSYGKRDLLTKRTFQRYVERRSPYTRSRHYSNTHPASASRATSTSSRR